jgi:hypothetical protein
MIEKLEILKEVQAELKRFTERLDAAILEQEKDKYATRHYATSKRAAMDLKHELTKLTQDSKYRWSKHDAA